jgi:hypothetical protein
MSAIEEGMSNRKVAAAFDMNETVTAPSKDAEENDHFQYSH